jgi:LPXTG-motif cell wall-anchored protein
VRLVGAAAIAGALVTAPFELAGAAAPPEPTYGTATVDGSAGEWAGGDAFGTLVSEETPPRDVASASLRYDCETGVLYVMVMAMEGESFLTTDPTEVYVRLGDGGSLVDATSGNDGSAPDFAFIGESGDTATGFEASAPVAEGSYPGSLRIHAKLPSDSGDGYDLVDLTPRYSDLTIACPLPATTTTEVLGETTMPPEGETTVPPLGETIDQPPAGEAPVVQGELARTGSSSGPLALLGIGLVAAGALAVRRSRTAAARP